MRWQQGTGYEPRHNQATLGDERMVAEATLYAMRDSLRMLANTIAVIFVITEPNRGSW